MTDVINTLDKVKKDATDLLDNVQGKVVELVSDVTGRIEDRVELPEIKALDDFNPAEIVAWTFDAAGELLAKQKEFALQVLAAANIGEAPKAKKPSTKKPAAKTTTTTAA